MDVSSFSDSVITVLCAIWNKATGGNTKDCIVKSTSSLGYF